MKLFLIATAVLSVAFAAPDSYGAPRPPTQPLRNGQRNEGTKLNIGTNRLSDTFDLQQRIPQRSSVNSHEDFSREGDLLSFDNERNRNQVGFNRQGSSVLPNNQDLRGSVFAGHQSQTGVGFQRAQTGLDTDENVSDGDDFFAGNGQRNQVVRPQVGFGFNDEELTGRFASGPREHAVTVFDRGQFGSPSNAARFAPTFNGDDQANASPITQQHGSSQTFRGDRRGLNSVAPGQQTGEYFNHELPRGQFESGVNPSRQNFDQRGSRDFGASRFQTNARDHNQLSVRGNIQSRPETPARRFRDQGVRQVQGPQHLAQNFRDTTNPCGQDEVIDFNGDCVRQKITRNIFVYQKPETEEDVTNEVREQTLSYNILFIKTSNEGSASSQDNEEKKTIVYVLNKEPTEEERKELQKDKHEVYFVNYKDGENPLLPHGSRLQAELNLSEKNGGPSSRFQQIAGNSNQTPLNSFTQNFDGSVRQRIPVHDISEERLVEERPGFGNSNQAIFFQNGGFQNSEFQRQSLTRDQGGNFSSSAFTNQQERANVFGNGFRGQNLSQTEFERPENSNSSRGSNHFAVQRDSEDIGSGYEAPRA